MPVTLRTADIYLEGPLLPKCALCTRLSDFLVIFPLTADPARFENALYDFSNIGSTIGLPAISVTYVPDLMWAV
jgi:hypothetical protein